MGNRVTGNSQALITLHANDGVPDWQRVEALLEEWQPQQLVVGLPLNMDDSEGELARLARKFGRRLEGRFSLPVDYMDERLSSFEAKQLMREQGHGGDFKAAPADALAAQLILESWLANQGESG